jgi:hypothetical protein
VTSTGGFVLEVVPWTIPGRCPLCGEPAQIEFDDAEGEPGNPVMMREVSCTNTDCAFSPPHATQNRAVEATRLLTLGLRTPGTFAMKG